MYKRILIHADGSIQGNRSVRLGINLARAIGAHPILLYVSRDDQTDQVMNSTSSGPLGLELLRRERNHARRDGRAPDAQFARSFDVAQTIIRAAQDENCDLIILASPQHKDLKTSDASSLAQKVMQASPIPVLIERDQSWAEPRGSFQWPVADKSEAAVLPKHIFAANSGNE